jgi:hypothetical protein
LGKEGNLMHENYPLVYLGHYLWMSFLLAVMMVIFAPRVLLRAGLIDRELRFRFTHSSILFWGIFALFLWFAGLAITAGPSPIIGREAAALSLRVLESGAALTCWAWLAIAVHSQVRLPDLARHRSADPYTVSSGGDD